MPHWTDTPNSHPATESMNRWSMRMNKELEKLNMPHSPPLVSSATEDLRSQHMLQKIGLLPQKGITPAAAHCAGCALVWLSPLPLSCFAIQSIRGVRLSCGHAHSHSDWPHQCRIEHFTWCLTHEHKPLVCHSLFLSVHHDSCFIPYNGKFSRGPILVFFAVDWQTKYASSESAYIWPLSCNPQHFDQVCCCLLLFTLHDCEGSMWPS